MHIGVDATCWQNNRGYGRHARALLRALVDLDASHEYTFFMDSTELAEALPERARVHRLASSTPTSLAASASGRRSMGDLWRTSRAMSAADLDLLLFPTIYSYVPVFTRAKKLIMIHDVIAETFPHLTLPRPAARLAWNAKVALGRWQADAIVTVSEYSRQGILRRFGLSPERVVVVGEASDPVFRRLENPQLSPHLCSLGLDAGRPIVVYVGGFSPHKNLEPLLESFHALVSRPEFERALLVMVGEYKKEVFHSYHATIAALAQRLSISDHVLFPGYLPDEELVALLNLSTVLVLPSLMEGFGLPAVEAAACGCPVIATRESPLPQLLGDGGIYIDPKRPEELHRALETVLASESLRRQMGDAAHRAASRLTWNDAAHQMLDVIKALAAG